MRASIRPEDALNPSRTDWTELFLSSTGRIGRFAFLGCAAVLAALGAAYDLAAGPGLRRWTSLVVHCALLFSAACIVSKRLHDRGRAGWWAFLPILSLIAVWPRPRGLVDGLLCLVLLTFAVDLGLLPGQARTNRFGLPPRF